MVRSDWSGYLTHAVPAARGARAIAESATASGHSLGRPIGMVRQEVAGRRARARESAGAIARLGFARAVCLEN
jgi:hypothetical protein